MDMAALRAQIPACEANIYLNSGFSGPLSVRAAEAMRGRLEHELALGYTHPEVFEEEHEISYRAHAAVAELLHVAPEEIALTENTTMGINIVLSGLRWNPGDEILTNSLEHSSVLVPAMLVRRHHGVTVNVVEIGPTESAEVIAARLIAALSPRTRLVFLSHVQASSGTCMPIQLIREGTRERNIPMLVDGAQGAGQVEADLSALDVDFYALPGQKWLLGPEGVGALYVRRDRIADLEARDGSRHSGRYDALSGELQWETGMRKFFTSTGSAVVRAGLCAALDLVREVGVPAIAARNRSLASRLKAGLRDQPGVAVYTPPDPPSSAGIVTLAVQGMRGPDTVKALRERCGIISRPIEPYQAARLSIHAFNTEDEIDRAAEAILELARGGLSG